MPLLQPPEDRNTDFAPTPEEDVAFRDRVEAVAAEKRAALLDPGPTWKEWFFFEATKWWIGLALFIVDIWLVVGWVEAGSVPLAVVSLVVAVYLEFLLARYLWHRPSEVRSRRRPFRPTWYLPVEVGIWTPEAAEIRAGRAVGGFGNEPRPEEFL